MSKPRGTGSPQIEVLAAKLEQEAVLANLLELYAHDFSELRDLDLGEDGTGSATEPYRFTGPSREDIRFLSGWTADLRGWSWCGEVR